MTTDEPRSGLPIEFLLAIVAEAGPGSPPIGMALEKARELQEGTHRDDLLLALLSGALSASAPQWILEAAVDSGLKEEAQPYEGSPLLLARAALAHPSCPGSLRQEALRSCSAAQLGALGREKASNAQDLWIGLGRGASRNAEGVPSRVIDFWSSSRPALARGSGRHARAQRSQQ